jgi:hypothetical protein
MAKIKLPIANKEVEMRGPKVKDMRAVEQYTTPAEKEVHLISNLTGMPLDEIDDLEMKDYALLQKEFSRFLS